MGEQFMPRALQTKLMALKRGVAIKEAIRVFQKDEVYTTEIPILVWNRLYLKIIEFCDRSFHTVRADEECTNFIDDLPSIVYEAENDYKTGIRITDEQASRKSSQGSRISRAVAAARADQPRG